MSEDSHPLADALARAREEERERALRALLARPLMTAAHSQFATVRRHAEDLRTWFAREAGWVLHVERACARLYKRPGDLGDATRGAPDFDRRRYVLFCLACAALERADPQITLKNLGERLLELAADPALGALGFAFALDTQGERRELVHVCRFLLALGVLGRVAGDEESYVQRAGDALYDIQRRVLATLPAAARGPSTYPPESAPAALEARLAALARSSYPTAPKAGARCCATSWRATCSTIPPSMSMSWTPPRAITSATSAAPWRRACAKRPGSRPSSARKARPWSTRTAS